MGFGRKGKPVLLVYLGGKRAKAGLWPGSVTRVGHHGQSIGRLRFKGGNDFGRRHENAQARQKDAPGARYETSRRCPNSHAPYTIITAPARVNQVMAYCR